MPLLAIRAAELDIVWSRVYALACASIRFRPSIVSKPGHSAAAVCFDTHNAPNRFSPSTIFRPPLQPRMPRHTQHAQSPSLPYHHRIVPPAPYASTYRTYPTTFFSHDFRTAPPATHASTCATYLTAILPTRFSPHPASCVCPDIHISTYHRHHRDIAVSTVGCACPGICNSTDISPSPPPLFPKTRHVCPDIRLPTETSRGSSLQPMSIVRRMPTDT